MLLDHRHELRRHGVAQSGGRRDEDGASDGVTFLRYGAAGAAPGLTGLANLRHFGKHQGRFHPSGNHGWSLFIH